MVELSHAVKEPVTARFEDVDMGVGVRWAGDGSTCLDMHLGMLLTGACGDLVDESGDFSS